MAESTLSGDANLPAGVAVPTVDESELPEAFRTPTRPVGLGFSLLLLLANVVLWITKFPVGQLLIASQVLAFDKANKISDLALITGIGSLLALVANPIAGALSDRTTGRFGRRRPWLLIGGILSSAMLFALAFAPGILGLLIEWTLFQIVTNAVLAALNAVLPDQVPVRQRATVSALIGMSIPLGALIGFALITQVFHAAIQPSYFTISAAFLIIIILFALVIPDQQLPTGIMPPFHPLRFLASFWLSPRKYPDFAWAWLTRFLMIITSAFATNFLLYYMLDVIHFPRASQGQAYFQYVYTGTLIIAAIVGGIFSDRIERRKSLALVSGCIVAVSMVILAFFHVFAAVLVAAVIFGIGFGIYLAVDYAIVTQVLPRSGDRGRDMGVINIANTLPQTLSAVVASVVLNPATFAPATGYTIFFVIGAVTALLSGILILPIKGVR